MGWSHLRHWDKPPFSFKIFSWKQLQHQWVIQRSERKSLNKASLMRVLPRLPQGKLCLPQQDFSTLLQLFCQQRIEQPCIELLSPRQGIWSGGGHSWSHPRPSPPSSGGALQHLYNSAHASPNRIRPLLTFAWESQCWICVISCLHTFWKWDSAWSLDY